MSCPLYIRSVYSLLSSMCSIDTIVSYGQKYGYKALGLVDRNVLSGAVAFRKTCQKAGIKPVFGLEFAVRTPEGDHIVVLYARDDEGFVRLMDLSSRLCTGQEKVIPYDEVKNYSSHNILCLLSDDMPLSNIRNSDPEELYKKQLAYFGDHIVGLADHDIADNAIRDNLLRPFLKQKGITMIAVNRTF